MKLNPMSELPKTNKPCLLWIKHYGASKPTFVLASYMSSQFDRKASWFDSLGSAFPADRWWLVTYEHDDDYEEYCDEHPEYKYGYDLDTFPDDEYELLGWIECPAIDIEETGA